MTNDEALLAALDQALDDFDPPPPGLIERVQFAIELEDLDVEVARWERADPLAGVRGENSQRTITFTVDDLMVMINLTPGGDNNQIDGWLVPPGQHSVEVRVAGHGSHETTADEDGRFVLDRVPCGTTQIVIHFDDRTVITPTVIL
ncbi:carboxypeptidase regulatory-like domain-containing protein [Kibdelosporangium philippinense]|uniref:Carboxypeptidase regulatory-like domain-containing protein n=1 Tax=Kibdelosporangium philippinense TaxID=211113 RepID=A0ABS8ZC77_9PSEU|nr:carboxypeptidase regulatory-like domain-containing protein [Kibdelosporangium philippinense]MCE7003432.1 carboxypeptidase regulatory-like domain-containing protein [Kibdelosporangium philippinense]